MPFRSPSLGGETCHHALGTGLAGAAVVRGHQCTGKTRSKSNLPSDNAEFPSVFLLNAFPNFWPVFPESKYTLRFWPHIPSFSFCTCTNALIFAKSGGIGKCNSFCEILAKNPFRLRKKMKNCAKVVQSRAKSCKVVQSRGKSWKVVQSRAKSCRVVQSRAKSQKK